MEVALVLFLIVYFFMAIDLLAEPLAEGFGYLLRFLFLCVLLVLKFTLLHALPWLIVHAFHAGVFIALKSWQGASLGFAFAGILIEEWRRGPEEAEEEFQSEEFQQDEYRAEQNRDGQHREEDHQERREEAPAADPYREAVQLLRLPSGFSPAELSRVYKQAIRAAHPDLGGSVALCQQINAARDLIRQTHGWK